LKLIYIFFGFRTEFQIICIFKDVFLTSEAHHKVKKLEWNEEVGRELQARTIKSVLCRFPARKTAGTKWKHSLF